MGQFANDEDKDELEQAAESDKDLADAPATAADSTADSDASQDAGAAAPTLPAEPDPYAHVAKKFGIEGYQGAVKSGKDAVDQARSNAAGTKSIAGFGHALATMFKGGGKVDDGFYNGLRSDADKQVQQTQGDQAQMIKNYLEQRGMLRQDTADDRTAQEFKHKQGAWGLEDAVNKQKLGDLADDRDPTKPKSLMAQQIARQFMPNQDWGKLTYDQFKSFGGPMQDVFNQHEQALSRQAQLSAANAYKDATLELTKRRLDDAEDNKGNNNVKAYAAGLGKSQLPDLVSALQSVDGLMPKSGDIPGQGPLMSAMPDMVASAVDGPNATSLRSAMANLFNMTLKDRNGARVTDPELERLRTEFGTGAWKSADQMREGVRQYTQRLRQVTGNINAGTDPGAVQQYLKNGGTDFGTALDQLQDSLGYPAAAEKGIQQVMHDNNVDRATAVAALKKAKKL